MMFEIEVSQEGRVFRLFRKGESEDEVVRGVLRRLPRGSEAEVVREFWRAT